MPVYEYLCDQCGRTTEELRRMAEADAPAVCEHCGSMKTKRAHSAPAPAPGRAGTGAGGDVSLPMGGGGCGCGNPAGPCHTR